jgi:6,7-dimethyl-8-ribityllumazine synthase
MAWIYEGNYDGSGLRVGIVVGRFNSVVTERLLDGAMDCLERHGVETDNVDIFWVPGAWEIPATARRLADGGSWDAVICLGAVIRGETPHFEYVAAESAKGVATVAMNSDVPVIYGIVTADTLDQAIDRAGAKSGNKGFDAAMAALEMVSVYEEIDDAAEGEEECEECAEGDEHEHEHPEDKDS